MGPFEKCLGDSGIDKRNLHDVASVSGSTRVPIVQKLIQEFCFHENGANRSITSDEAVDSGAAVIFSSVGFVVGHQLCMGLETAGDIMTKLVERSTTIPLKKRANIHNAR